MHVIELDPTKSLDEQAEMLAQQISEFAVAEALRIAETAAIVTGICPACVTRKALGYAFSSGALQHAGMGPEATNAQKKEAAFEYLKSVAFPAIEAALRSAQDNTIPDPGSAPGGTRTAH